MGDAQPTGRRFKLPSLERLTSAFQAIRSVSISAAVVLAFLFLLQEAWRPSIEIEAFQVPPALGQRGLTGEVVANRIADQMSVIDRVAQTSFERHTVRQGADPTLEGAVVPGTSVSVATITRYVRRALGWTTPRVTGELVLNTPNGSGTLVVRVRGQPGEKIPIAVDALDSDAAFLAAARHIYHHTQPYILASYLYATQAPDTLDEILFVLRTPPDDDDARAHNLWGLVLADRGALERAIAKYEAALALDPRAGYAWFNYGLALHELGRTDQAIGRYQHALDLDPDFAYARRSYGDALSELGRLDEAIDSYRRALDLDPQAVDAWNNYGLALTQLGRYDEAIERYRRALELDPELAYAWNNYGNALSLLGRRDEAVERYRRALELDEEYVDAWYNYGSALFALERYAEAIEQYRRAVELEPGYVDAWINYGNALYELELYPEAIQSYGRALAIDPENPEVEANLERARSRAAAQPAVPDIAAGR